MNHPIKILLFLIITFLELGFGTTSKQNISKSLDKINKLSHILHTNLDSIFTKEYVKAFGRADASNLLSRVVVSSKKAQYRSNTKKDYFIQFDDIVNSRVIYFGFIYRSNQYVFYYRLCLEGKNITINSINRTLKLDFEQEIEKEIDKYQTKYANDTLDDLANDAICTIRPVNFTHNSGNHSDFLVYVEFFGSDISMSFGFVLENGQYYPRFKYVGAGKSAVTPKLIDIDSDGKMELLLIADEAGNQSGKDFITIWRYQRKRFEEIFREGLSEGYMYCPYFYHNSYSFIKNPINNKMLDISFHVSTDTEFFDVKEPISFYKRYGNFLPKKDSTIFVFNGTKYIPKKKFYDYRAFFRRWCKENNFRE